MPTRSTASQDAQSAFFHGRLAKSVPSLRYPFGSLDENQDQQH
jgi:hypothetical protein